MKVRVKKYPTHVAWVKHRRNQEPVPDDWLEALDDPVEVQAIVEAALENTHHILHGNYEEYLIRYCFFLDRRWIQDFTIVESGMRWK